MSSLQALLLKNEQEKAREIYLRQPKNGIWYELTWAEVMLQVRKIAAFLLNLGLKKGSRISIISKNCSEWFIADFGIHLAGMVSVPLFTNQHEESIHYILEHAEVELVFIGKLDNYKEVRDYIPRGYRTIGFDYYEDMFVDYSWATILGSSPLKEVNESAKTDLHTIIYTSGTTGLPKGAQFTNKAISEYLQIFPQDLQRISTLSHHRLVSYLPLAHVYERSSIQLASVSINCTVSFIESLGQFSKNLQDIQPTLFTAVPRIWGVFQEKIEKRLSPISLNFLLKLPLISFFIKRKIIKELGFNACCNFFSGAAPLPYSILNFFDQIGIPIQEGYGQTENLAYCTFSVLNERRYGYVGTARLKVKIKAEQGELLVYSPCIMAGYYKDMEATQAALSEDGWLRTGDLVEIDDLGRVKIVGRTSEEYKNQSGEFVAPSPIEQLFEGINYIEQLCLVGRGLASNVLLITLRDYKDAIKEKGTITQTIEDKLQQVNKKLNNYEKIRMIIIVKELWTTDNDLLTPTLKVKRKNVEKYYSSFIQLASKQAQNVVWEN